MTLPTIQLPNYELELPVSKKRISFRPFIVKEEKVLLIALEESDTEKLSTSLKHILRSCTYDKIDIDGLPKTDAEYLFLNIRNKSMGEEVDAISTCLHCEKKNFITLDFSKIIVTPPEKDLSDTIVVANKLWVKMKQPSLDIAYELTSKNTIKDITQSMAKCVVSIINDDAVIEADSHSLEEITAWMEGMTDDAYGRIGEFLSNTHTLKLDQEYACTSCGEKNRVILEGLDGFFA